MNAIEQASVDWVVELAAVNRANVSGDAEFAAWRYSSVAELLLEHGRLFTPGPTISDRGPWGACYRNASTRADRETDEVYVEGLACKQERPWLPLEHAWCALGDQAVDPSWPVGVAYIGVAFTDEFRRRRQRHTGHCSLLWSGATRELLREEIPTEAFAQVGRAQLAELPRDPHPRV
ncbi:MAG TPA: hypothetical protein VE196_13950 [Pseudonocardiaceae bacterium]|nr:hypothetical protein [Pseudonocardiaceae bacterium]